MTLVVLHRVFKGFWRKLQQIKTLSQIQDYNFQQFGSTSYTNNALLLLWLGGYCQLFPNWSTISMGCGQRPKVAKEAHISPLKGLGVHRIYPFGAQMLWQG